jgi:transcription elongation factor Elf1
MPLFGIRDHIYRHRCPHCQSRDTVRTGRTSDGTRTIRCRKCGYSGPLEKPYLMYPSDMYAHNNDDKQ